MCGQTVLPLSALRLYVSVCIQPNSLNAVLFIFFCFWGSQTLEDLLKAMCPFPQEKSAYTAHIFIEKFKWIGYPEIVGPHNGACSLRGKGLC